MNRDEVIKAYRNIFNSPDGKVILEDLKAQFYNRSLGDDNVNVVLQKVGSRDAVQYIIDRAEE